MSWTPPENPDPEKILDEAVEDTRNENYDIALHKLLWFHDHALSIRPSLSGVRRSYALNYWRELGHRYPPALEKLIEVRDQTIERCRRESYPFESFHDICALNRYLEESHLTVELFLEADEKFPESAKRIYNIAEPALIATENYEISNFYLDPVERLKRAQRMLEVNRRMMKEMPEFEDENPRFPIRKFCEKIGTLIALLIMNQRRTEAEALKENALNILDDEQMHQTIEDALEGIFPKGARD